MLHVWCYRKCHFPSGTNMSMWMQICRRQPSSSSSIRVSHVSFFLFEMKMFVESLRNLEACKLDIFVKVNRKRCSFTSDSFLITISHLFCSEENWRFCTSVSQKLALHLLNIRLHVVYKERCVGWPFVLLLSGIKFRKSLLHFRFFIDSYFFNISCDSDQKICKIA